MQDFDVGAVAARMTERRGGFDVVHTSPGLEVGVYVLIERTLLVVFSGPHSASI